MEALYHQTSRLIQETQSYFQNLERKPPNSEEIENEIQSKIDAISSNCDRLDILIFKAPVTQRQIAKMRCDQLKYDNRHIQAALNSIRERRNRVRKELEEREQLLSRRFTSNDSQDHTIQVDSSTAQYQSLQSAHRGVDDMLMTGSNVLSNLRNQRETLKGAHRRLIDIVNNLGLSNTTITLIEKRARQDKLILIGGMLLTLSVIGIVIKYFT